MKISLGFSDPVPDLKRQTLKTQFIEHFDVCYKNRKNQFQVGYSLADLELDQLERAAAFLKQSFNLDDKQARRIVNKRTIKSIDRLIEEFVFVFIWLNNFIIMRR